VKDFAALGVLPVFAEKLVGRGITRPTEIQRLAIPPLLEGRSIVFRSATGTGKTFAWLIPALQRLLADIDCSAPGDDTAPGDGAAAGKRHLPYRGPRVLICAPSYELCSQIKAEIDFLTSSENIPAGSLPSALLIGSVNLNRQIDSLKKGKPLIAVGNPGRLLTLAKMGKLKFRDLNFFVLDEADRLTADDSREESDELLRLIARETSGLVIAACSATVSAKTSEQLLSLRMEAAFIETDEQEILREKIEHWAIFSESRRKVQTLRSFLAAAKPGKALIFIGRSDEAEKIASQLQYHHISAAALSGNTDKKNRKEAIDGFRSGKIKALVSSDLAARGLDIPGLSHVIALHVPADSEVYIHRAGRTARAGKRGIMVSIGDEIEMRRLAALEKKLGIIVRPKELYQGKVCDPE
jgi:superfamily II DNA/RNA helicase